MDGRREEGDGERGEEEGEDKGKGGEKKNGRSINEYHLIIVDLTVFMWNYNR